MPAQDFETIHATLRPRVVSFLRRLAGPEEAEDLAQEVFLKVHRGLPEFRGESKVSTWVFQIAARHALDHLRRRVAPCVQPQAEFDCAPAPGEAGPVMDEMNTCVRDMVAALPTDYRIMLSLCELKEFRIGEIAALLGISEGAAKIRLHRARALLRTRMEKGCRILLDERAELQCDRKAP
ncbi:RNA polymerase sigma factor [Mesoterricola silvestris]|uniref:RNA polymerase sigma factor n=1 Tax=Mesoterricola silvestris TaxID=2927979 RepID=A0AA48GLH9_9BACT|nr:RNA polymerase sigma factor [Mesoterricola silvestris]BDU71665.1 RNA polymerase sigma factor [Mesoterricola silvestris]